MKILFIVPPYHTNNGHVPNGIGVVATVAKKAGFDVGVLLSKPNEPIESFYERMVDEIRRKRIDVVATGGHSKVYRYIEELIAKAKEAGAITVLGGYIVDASPELVPDNIGADYCVYGEGEYTFVELIHAIQKGEEPGNVKGIIYKKDGQLIKTPPRECVPNLDELPFVDGELCHMSYTLSNNSSLMLYISRSCPFNCTFCYNMQGSYFRSKSNDYIFREIDYYLALYGDKIQMLFFVDDLISMRKDRLMDFCERVKPYNLPYTIQLRIDSVDEKCIIALKESGCVIVFYGIESANNKVLKSMKKSFVFEDAEKILALTSKHGLELAGNFIIGDVEDNLQTISYSEEFYRKHGLEYNLLQMYLIALYPGSALYKYAVEHGHIKDELEFIRAGCPYTNISKIPESIYNILWEKYWRYTYQKYLMLNQLLMDENTEFSLSRNGALSYSGYCPFCYTKIGTPKLHTEPFVVEFDNICPQCSKLLWFRKGTVFPSDPLDASIISDLMKARLREHHGKKIAIWGVTDAVRRMLYHSQELRDMVVKIVDINYINMTNQTFCGLLIENPEVLRETEFDCILSGATLRRAEIETALNEMGIDPIFIEIDPSCGDTLTTQ